MRVKAKVTEFKEVDIDEMEVFNTLINQLKNHVGLGGWDGIWITDGEDGKYVVMGERDHFSSHSYTETKVIDDNPSQRTRDIIKAIEVLREEINLMNKKHPYKG